MFKELNENIEDIKRRPSLISRDENYNSKDFFNIISGITGRLF